MKPELCFTSQWCFFLFYNFFFCWLCIVILFSYWFCFPLDGCALPFLFFCVVVLLFFVPLFFSCCYVVLFVFVLPHCFAHIAMLLFSCCSILIFFALLHCFSRPYLNVLFALPCYAFHATSLLLSCCLTLLVLIWCSSHIIALLFSCCFFTLLPMLHCFSCIALAIRFALPLLFFSCCMLCRCSPHINVPLVLVFNLQVPTRPTPNVAMLTTLLLFFLCYYCSCFLGMVLPLPFLPCASWSYDTKLSSTKGEFFFHFFLHTFVFEFFSLHFMLFLLIMC